jgi:methyl-accepting chemotaxis protein
VDIVNSIYSTEIEPYILVLSHLKDMLQEDVMACITNKTHFLAYFPGEKIKVPVDIIGTEIKKGEPLLEAMKANKVIENIVPKELFGFPFKSVAYPIKNEAGEVVGAIGIGRSLEKDYIIEQASETLTSSLGEINLGLQDVASGSQELSMTINDAVKSASESSNKIKEINDVINAIGHISSQSNLLGLNAAIEAARAGESGRGFAVVAGEMRKLAMQSNESAKKVSQTLMDIKNSIESVISKINQIDNIAYSQAASTEEVKAALDEIMTSSLKLSELSKIGQ